MKASLQAVAVPTTAAIAALFIAGTPAQSVGQTVYRCGNAYSQAPCPSGTALQVDDARSAAQKQQTDAAAMRDAKVADAMEKERLKREAHVAPPVITPARPMPKEVRAQPAKKPASKKKGKGNAPEALDFSATDGKTKAKEKAAEKKAAKAAKAAGK